MTLSLEHHDALLVVDMQLDFLDGGSLAVEGSLAIIPVVNGYIDRFKRARIPIFACRDWHPENHCSFVEHGGIWPPHCVAESSGAAFHPDLCLPPGTYVASKGTRVDRDAYSALDGTEMEREMRAQDVQRVFVCGLATDYCVLASARDLAKSNFDVVILEDAIRAVDVRPGDGERAIEEMLGFGTREIVLEDLA